MKIVRSFFLTFRRHEMPAESEAALRKLGAVAIDPARRLAPRRLWLCPCCTGVDFADRPEWLIYRADFSRAATRKEIKRSVPFVNRIRGSLETAPQGQDLPPALRPIPDAQRLPMPRQTGLRKHLPRLHIGLGAGHGMLSRTKAEQVLELVQAHTLHAETDGPAIREIGYRNFAVGSITKLTLRDGSFAWLKFSFVRYGNQPVANSCRIAFTSKEARDSFAIELEKTGMSVSKIR